MISIDVHTVNEIFLYLSNFSIAILINLLLLIGTLYCYHFSHADGDMV